MYLKINRIMIIPTDTKYAIDYYSNLQCRNAKTQ